LAPAGEFLRTEARVLLGSAETVQRRVRVADREGRSVTIGFLPGAVLTPMVRHLEGRFPGLRVDVVRTSWTEQIAGLRDGRFDACVAQRPFDDEGLTVVDLWAEPRTAVLPVGHPCAGKAEVSVADLAGDVLLQPVAAVPGWPGAGADLAKITGSPTMEEKFEQVAAGRGIIVVPESATRYYRHPDLAVARVTDLPEARICLVVESRRSSAVLRELVAAAVAHVDAASAQA
jgi:DNA-binding transcriptional LysR family regulator